MLLYYVGIAACMVLAGILLATVNWYTALPAVGIALALYFMGMSKAHANSEGSDAR